MSFMQISTETRGVIVYVYDECKFQRFIISFHLEESVGAQNDLIDLWSGFL